jgi:hypothetical protein
MIVARHEMPGTRKKQPVPEGRLKMSGRARFFVNSALAQNQASLQDAIALLLFQALRAWLLSFSPSGTKTLISF